MRLIVGLRNPGADYQQTRHNLGLEVVETLSRRHGSHFRRGPLRVRSELVEIGAGSEKLVLAAPLSFMNEAGGPVRAVLQYLKIAYDDLLVVHDDIDLGFGRLRLQVGGGSGGHNGIRSVERSLGTREFSRLKMGVGRPPERMDPAAFVLQRFSKSERPEIELVIEDAADVVEKWVEDPARAQEQASHRRT